ncbi:adenosylcobinamide amidohydrolase [Prosthecodimorpha staleyi]|uniref:Adenosylcobinamide amidohydrolase n=1 Tax=Prosthecodimorpha staleyi TaxID=2840188 RepID=A0A947D0M1_9HYPH|nr:adenosylcobinamide amidohydrolase [Prosthecodimorpha staleyi]MBT9288159.1 adenosylcobinamide amidohydrolase [Prosthecodimorpha staleyi]
MSVAEIAIDCRQPWLVARFAGPRRMLSWSPNRPGFAVADAVAWLEVTDADVVDLSDPAGYLRARLAAASLQRAVGLMTARDVRRHHLGHSTVDGIGATALTTAGLTNGERIGERCTDPALRAAAGTINTLVHVTVPLTRGAFLEAMSLAVQARTVAVAEAGIRRGGSIITGTGTDCLVVAAPPGPQPAVYAGLHTAIGEAVGAAVLSATRAAVAGWVADQTGNAP